MVENKKTITNIVLAGTAPSIELLIHFKASSILSSP